MFGDLIAARKVTISPEDDGLWHAEDYDDEPRSHGNFDIDPCMLVRIAEAEARQRKEWKCEMELADEFMREHRGLRKRWRKA